MCHIKKLNVRFPVVPYLDLDNKFIIMRILSRRHSSVNTLAAQPLDCLELKQPPVSHGDIISPAGSVPVGSFYGARRTLQPSSSCHAAVSLSGPDRQRCEDDSPGMRAQEQVETIDSTLGSNYERNPRGCSEGTYGLFKSIKNTAEPQLIRQNRSALVRFAPCTNSQTHMSRSCIIFVSFISWRPR